MIDIYIHIFERITEARVRCSKCQDNDKVGTELDGDAQEIVNRLINELEDCIHL